MTKAPTSVGKMKYLEGLRAVAMLIVLNFHAITSTPDSESGNVVVLTLQRYCLHGQVGVVIFIVLSGFCLMLPVARSESGTLRGGLFGFARRRALRILPAYYVALFASIAIAWSTTVLHSHTPGSVRSFSTILFPRNILSHIFLVHNFWFDTAFSINGPLWSVATEWQIYFIFALVLLPVWRRFGIAAAVAGGFLLGILPALLLPVDDSYYWARPWYLGLFALGMATAAVCFPRSTSKSLPLGRIPFPLALLLLGITMLGLYVTRHLYPSWPVDSLVGLFTASLVGCCTQATQLPVDEGRRVWGPRLARFLEQPWMIWLASISYSIYLLQHIFFRGLLTLADARHISALTVVCLNYFLAIPATIVAAILLARYFETPFLERSRRESRDGGVVNVTRALR